MSRWKRRQPSWPRSAAGRQSNLCRAWERSFPGRAPANPARYASWRIIWRSSRQSQMKGNRVAEAGETGTISGETFTAEVGPHLHVLYRMALRLTSDEQSAEDLVQDTLERAFANFARYQSGTNVRAWMLRIMNNAWISNFRRQSRRPRGHRSKRWKTSRSIGRSARRRRAGRRRGSRAEPNRRGDVLQAIDGLTRSFGWWCCSPTSKDFPTRTWPQS